jgi:hypothetical protein
VYITLGKDRHDLSRANSVWPSAVLQQGEFVGDLLHLSDPLVDGLLDEGLVSYGGTKQNKTSVVKPWNAPVQWIIVGRDVR